LRERIADGHAPESQRRTTGIWSETEVQGICNIAQAVLQIGCETMMDKKKFVSAFLVAHLILGIAAIAFLGAAANSFQGVMSPAASPSPINAAFTVITSSYSGIPYDLYCPSNFSGSLVILAGGILGEKHYLKGWGEALAENGYAALAFSTEPEDLQHVPEYVEDCRSNIETLLSFVFDESLFPIPINQSDVSLVGMSGGGATVLSVSDTRIIAEVAVCPYYIKDVVVDNICPTLIITGETDPITPHDTNGDVYYDELAPDKMIAEQAGIGHDISPVGWKYVFAWLDYCIENDNTAYSTITNVGHDSGILSYESDFSVDFAQ